MIRVLRGYASFRHGLGALSAIAVGMTLVASSAAAATIALPAKYKQQGELTFAFNAAYAPMEFIANDGKTMIGLDIDLANAIAKKLGVKAKFVQAGFDTIIPGLQSDRYDLSMSSFTITKKREEVMDFVSYFTAGTSFYVKAKGGPAVASLGDLCGLSVAVTKGTIQSEDATKQNQECKAAGKKGVDVQFYPDQNAASLAMDSGRAQVCMADSPVAAWIVKESRGKFKLSGVPYNSAPYGIVIPKNSGLAEPVLQAVKAVMADGEYTKILKKWGAEQGAITTPEINPAVQ
ncbi:MAG TPA: ABC transporter substrate-binding protein [Thiomonas arsenitoxydans]|uniref:ABC transporter substrate-binding protein n=1 Tax=Thiomonas TaxID=32012 RepID=UPI0007C2F5A5|nr:MULTISPECIES: ABC transporter substrate-binding protein [Thiomonas]MDD5001261.1 ABC transporter substrate-binding protein [Thiomonas arsenitoxydans]CQR41453.1 Extracellular solute-binding protein family 3 [Thiomonas sp. CB3]HML82661.1 ABC transporter substrate-binding protein [Thiomonas arsenitoxydans]